ncbi:hypothetical protein KFZ70_11510 [Tamlana fucoidanivorans]|uniref:Uncharacterized protein n=1 Tax=Allotamlana fucoidanivorans TaxID=2583814 RepID=A0A5C4SHS5_9FLAO|nr:hypothetical protein [Tamlana fucoidanivorans]TNJ43103.1 hypothetical protein FGF67_12130 [Tamlana fucoidanivorans]
MILKGFKEKSIKKKLNKLLSERCVNTSDNKVASVGVVVNIDEFESIDVFEQLVSTLGVNANRLKVISFSEHITEDLNTWDERYNPKDFSWDGAVKNTSLQSFLDTNFDVLISYYEQDKLELKLITASSKAMFKIGTLESDMRLNDLIIKIPLKAFDVFKEEVFKYLKILNKIE